jgi:uncharacterized protein (TIGR03000 family)
MRDTRFWYSSPLALLALTCLSSVLVGQEASASRPAYLEVYVPPDARLTIDTAPTQQTGSNRRFQSPPLPTGQVFTYHLKASWIENGREVISAKDVRVAAGQETRVDLRQDQKERTPDVIFVPTPQEVVDKMLEMVQVKKGDIVYDLGCGDGRIVVTAAKKYGVKGIGIDIDPDRIRDSLENVRKNKVENLVTIKKADIFTEDFSDATVVTLYLLPQLNVKLMPQLAKLKPGTRIVSHDFDMRGAKPVKTVRVKPEGNESYEHTIYMWIVPWEKE